MLKIPTSPSAIKAAAMSIPPVFIHAEVLTREHQKAPSLVSFKNLIELGKTHRFAKELVINKEIAMYLLSVNDGNRNRKNAEIIKIKAAIENNEFVTNGETIIISNDGRLNDGQNRLHAISQSGKSVTVLVAFGYQRTTRKSVDSVQTSRSAVDLLVMEGVKASPLMKNIGSLLAHYERYGTFKNTASLGADKVSAYTQEHEKEIQTAIDLIDQKAVKFVMHASLVGAMLVLTMRASSIDHVKEFTKGFISGEGLKASDPAHILRTRFMQETKKPKSKYDDFFEMYARSWNHFRSGTASQRIVVKGETIDLKP